MKQLVYYFDFLDFCLVFSSSVLPFFGFVDAHSWIRWLEMGSSDGSSSFIALPESSLDGPQACNPWAPLDDYDDDDDAFGANKCVKMCIA